MKRNRTNDESKIKQLNRHYAILSREIAIDNSDKETLEREFETYIEKALVQYGELLRLSSEPDVQTVFPLCAASTVVLVLFRFFKLLTYGWQMLSVHL